MRIAIDYTSAIAQNAGVGRYTRSLVHALSAVIDERDRLILWYAARGRVRPDSAAFREPDRVELRRVPLPSRLTTLAWQRLRLPVRLERFTGQIDVAHEPDFVTPPSLAPSIVTIHDLSYLITPEFAVPTLASYLRQAVPRTLERASHVVTPSETTRRDVIEQYGLDPAKVSALLNGVDEWFRPPSATAIQQATARFGLTAPYFLIVGTVEPRKNHGAVLRAFEALHRRFPEVRLVILGHPGWLSEPIIAQIEAAAVRSPVRYLRFVDDSWLPALYAGSVALVYPSWYEGFGLPVVEAMASGTAVITSDRGSLPEVVGDSAFVVPPDDDEALRSAMETLLVDSAKRQHMIEAGLIRACQFSWDNAAHGLYAIYKMVAQRP